MVHDLNTLTDILEKRFSTNSPFSLLRMPNSEKVIENGEVALIPFNASWSERFQIDEQGDSLDIFFESTEKSEYLKNIHRLISELKSNGNKVVISRVINGNISNDEQKPLPLAITELIKANPYAFALVIRSARGGLWVIISPELLLKETEVSFETVALAGTRSNGTETDWDKKNIREQRYVTDYILKKWQSVGLSPEEGTTHTLKAGKVEHICTPITAQKSGIHIEKIIDSMNPTPAVCGAPQEYALEKIKHIENHKRLLYAGATAVLDENGNHSVFVNLRCFHLNRDGRYNIFVGGGITGDSSPEDEWNETEMKAQQLLDCLHSNNSNDNN